VAETTTIEWTDRTWNPVTGCTKISAGCDHCYAETIAERFRGHAAFPKGFDVQIRADKVNTPLTWRKPVRVFVNSMSDLFHDQVDQAWIADIFAVIAASPRHTFQLLTKRHARMRNLLNDPAWVEEARSRALGKGLPAADWTWPLPNLWLGVSVENQKWADIRIPALTQTPAAVRFLSCEPLLGPVWIREHIWQACACCEGEGHDEACPRCADAHCDSGHTRQIDWVIVGGESGRNARAMHPDWARSLRDQCTENHVPFFFKQWGEWGPAPFIVRVCDPNTGWQGTDEELAAAKADSEARGATHVHTGNWYDENGERNYWIHEIGHKPWSLERCALPDGAAPIRRWGKKRAGRELDARTWNQFPSPR
jgi:protein gp37